MDYTAYCGQLIKWLETKPVQDQRDYRCLLEDVLDDDTIEFFRGLGAPPFQDDSLAAFDTNDYAGVLRFAHTCY